jgi:endonuclease YncB( thermonuclease family)
MRSRRQRKDAELKFNLSGSSRTGASWLPLFALFALTGVFCATVLFALNPARPAAEGSLPISRLEMERAADAGQSSFQQTRIPGRALGAFSSRFEKCGRHPATCVVDGDTFWLNGEKIRIADIDTPEISQPRCTQELQLGLVATRRLIELLNEGEFELTSSGGGDVDRYGRKLRVVTRGSESIGEKLVREGLAHRWVGRKLSWCER